MRGDFYSTIITGAVLLGGMTCGVIIVLWVILQLCRSGFTWRYNLWGDYNSMVISGGNISDDRVGI